MLVTEAIQLWLSAEGFSCAPKKTVEKVTRFLIDRKWHTQKNNKSNNRKIKERKKEEEKKSKKKKVKKM